jgi:hypothetical protein
MKLSDTVRGVHQNANSNLPDYPPQNEMPPGDLSVSGAIR